MGDHVSLKWQTSLAYGSAFSYCLPQVSSEAGFFTLSAPASDTAAAATFSFKPMVRNNYDPMSYFSMLTGISVGGKRLAIPLISILSSS
uniref:Xylanase inhibitor N-terminal domain-containing protein n=1 Tax=Oryza barthii TaxID=65489 RepID=A0A0D3GFS6_9ORYZ